MDDEILEQPFASAPTQNQAGDVDEENDPNEDAADGGLDWAKLRSPAASRPVIPKRGEKEFEPRTQAFDNDANHPSTSTISKGTALQQHVLNRAREAMFEALRATRTVSSKNISYGIWYPSLSRTHVTVARGIHFSNMGHSAPRPVDEDDDRDGNACRTGSGNGKNKIQKRLELLPEETIYLVERGSMLCWNHIPSAFDMAQIESAVFGGHLPGPPMSVQQVYTEMMGRENLTLEKFQVYAYLKRLGYAVMRAEPPDPYYPTSVPFTQAPLHQSSSLFQRVTSLFSRFLSAIVRLLTGRNSFDWWHPIKFTRWLHHDKNYHFLFKSLRFIPSGHRTPPYETEAAKCRRLDTPYKIFYNVYKPSTPFKKSAPGKPDFQVVVVDARTTPMPTLYELATLFDQVPEIPPPLPRRKNANLEKNVIKGSATEPSTTHKEPLLKWLLSLVQSWLFPSRTSSNATRAPPRPNPFVSLKAGKKVIVIAAVDSGNISFFRFGQGAFEEWPMV